MAACAGLGLDIGRQNCVPGQPAGRGARDDGGQTWVPGQPGGRGARDDGGQQDPPARSLARLQVVPAVPAGKVTAGWVIRRWQPGQSAEGNLLADGQYTNLSVRQ